MKFGLLYLLLISIIAVSFIQSCSSTKYVPEGEYWLQNASVKSDTKKISPLDMEPYVRQKPNYRTLAIFRLPLFMYNLSGSDTTKWINRVLRSGGEPPVIFDSTMVEKTVMDMTKVLNNKGFVHAEVVSSVNRRDRKVQVEYNIISGDPYKIVNYDINIPDSVFASKEPLYLSQRGRRETIDSTSTDLNKILLRNTTVKENSIFDLNMLDEERNRVTSVFRRFGYFNFNKEYIGFIADTTVGKNQVGLELTIYPFMEKIINNGIVERPHRQYIVEEVNFYVDFNPLEDGDISNYVPLDTITRENGRYKIFYGKRGIFIKPFVILDNNYIVAGNLYNENSTSMTYNSLSQLHILRNVSIKYEMFTKNDSTKLKCIITCIPDKRQGFSTEIEGTNSGNLFGSSNLFGIGASFGYLHRNLFRGSELFNFRLQGSYEAITPSFTTFRDNYFEIGGETSITFPRFMFPFLKKDIRRKLHASTQLSANYIYQRRPDYFTRTVLSSRVRYLWQGRRNNLAKHSFDLFEINYSNIPYLNPEFSEKLTPQALEYSFTSQFILSTGYTFTKTNYNLTNRKRLSSIYSIRASVETAGNLLSLIANITNAESDELGKKLFGTRYAQYVLGTGDYSRAIPIDDKNAIAWRIGGGLVYPYGNNQQVLVHKRFFSGGANSVRGWAIRELGPGAFFREGATFVDHSGDIRFDANIEYRSKVFWKLELAAFLDAGNIWTVKKYENQENGDFRLDSFYKQIATAWGLGFRLDFDFVVVRLDCGWKMYDPAIVPIYKFDTDGTTLIVDRYKSHWPITNPFNLRDNTSWHIAVGYPF